MIIGLDAPAVVLSARAAALLARPLGRLVADAGRDGVAIEECVLEALADCERVRRLLVAAKVPPAEPAEPKSAEPPLDSVHEADLSTDAAADILGWSPSYLRRQARHRRIGVKVGTSWRFAPGDIALLVDARSAH